MQQNVSPLAESYLWLALAALLLLALGGAVAYALLWRGRAWLAEPHARLDAWLSEHTPQFWHFIKHRFSREAWHGLTLTVAAGCFLLLTYLFALVTESWIDQEALYLIDQRVYEMLGGALSEATITVLRVVTYAGDLVVAGSITIALALYFLLRRMWWRLTALGLAIGGGQALLWSMKWIFGRARPDAPLASTVGHAFPSGHTFTAVVLYGFVIYLIWRGRVPPALRLVATGFFSLLIVGVGLSRVLLSVHWVSDVVGGFLIGLAWLLFSLVLTRALQTYRRTRVPQQGPSFEKG